MSLHVALIVGGLLINLLLGVAVYLANPQRGTNRQFLILAIPIGLWLVFVGMALMASSGDAAAFWIRQATVAAVFVPVGFEQLRRAIHDPQRRFGALVRDSRGWCLVACAVAVLLETPAYVKTAIMPPLAAQQEPPQPVYGWAFYAFAAYYLIVWGLLVLRFVRDTRAARGLIRAELQFIQLGAGGGVFMAIATVLVLPAFTQTYRITHLAPLCVVFLDATIAYGIATRRIMDVAYLLRLAVAYILLTVYLILLYMLVWWTSSLLLGAGGAAGFFSVPALLAALAVAFSVAPTHGVFQRFANRLFVHVPTVSAHETVRESARLLQSVGTVDQLLAEFAAVVTRTVGIDRVEVYLDGAQGFQPRYPHGGGRPIAREDALSRLIEWEAKPLVKDVVRRMRRSALEEESCRDLDARDMAVAVPIRAKEGLTGIVLVGPRLSGRIYGVPEQEALQLLCNQLGIALENAKLYTELQNGKIYNDILLDSLVSGVIAANREGRVTVFNREAQRITRLDASRVLARPMEELPAALADALRSTLQSGVALRDQDLNLSFGPGDETSVRAGSTVFRGQAGDVLGVLVVMHDLTALRKLELQVRRGDRLASLGTLSAGMAHEIKNPLVTIKTFTELLPTRYDDPDFRETFFSLVGGEVRRIDTIVNQLLRFARPSKPMLAPTRLHEVLSNALKLLGQQFRNRNVEVVRALEAPNDSVSADSDQLSQALINMMLNAADSMASGGTLTVATRAAGGAGQDGAGIEVTIRDTGEGIRPENVAHIFDPFFSTKSHGTGLGLSVAHGIVQDHGGSIDVESEPGKGTVFRIVLPCRAGGGGAA